MKDLIDKQNINPLLENYGLRAISINMISTGLSDSSFMVITETNKYVAKIFSKNSNIDTEVSFSAYLYKNKFPVPKIIENSNKQLITKHGDMLCVLYEYCKGHEIGWGSESSVISKELAENLAEIISKMHGLMLNNKSIKANTLVQMCLPQKIESLKNNEVVSKYRKINKEAKNIDTNNFKKALIHSDLTRENIFISDDRETVTAIIDFGDAHYDFIAWDLAVLLTQIFITKSWGIDWNGIKWFLKKYYELFPLTKTEKESILTFIKVRNISLALEVDSLEAKGAHNSDMLKSIESSVLKKIALAEKNSHQLSTLITKV